MPTTTNYIWDEDNLLAEADGTNTIQTVYTNEPEQYGNLISSRISGTTSYHHFDEIGSTRQLSNAAGTVTDTMIYDAWGNVVSRTGTTGALHLWIGEIGYYFDPETGMVYIRERPYGRATGRWTAPDPAAFQGILRLAFAIFAYCCNNPTNLVDPSGRISVSAVKEHLGAMTCDDEPSIQWTFTLDKAKHCDGYIVQKVRILCSGKTCAKKPADVGREHTYWEAWHVPYAQQQVVDTAAWTTRKPPSCVHYEQDG